MSTELSTVTERLDGPLSVSEFETGHPHECLRRICRVYAQGAVWHIATQGQALAACHAAGVVSGYGDASADLEAETIRVLGTKAPQSAHWRTRGELGAIFGQAVRVNGPIRPEERLARACGVVLNANLVALALAALHGLRIDDRAAIWSEDTTGPRPAVFIRGAKWCVYAMGLRAAQHHASAPVVLPEVGR